MGLPLYLLNLLKKEIPFSLTWAHAFLVAVSIGALFVFITIFLEPHGTDQYEASFRYLRLSGYALCHIVPYMLFYGIERQIWKRTGSWYVYHELISKSLLIVLISTTSWFYNIFAINSISPTLTGWTTHFIQFGLPYVPVIAPLAIGLHIFLLNQTISHSPGHPDTILITGKNKNDVLEIEAEHFVYAESSQNYVTIYYVQDAALKKVMIRSSLKEVAGQIQGSVRVHRSFLINVQYLIEVTGNKRQRFASMQHTEKLIPLSAELESLHERQ